MSTTNRITVARHSIDRAIKTLQSQLSTDIESYEVEINESTMLYLETTVGGLDYNTIEINELTVIEDSEKGYKELTNIASYIESEILKTINYINAESRSDYENWNDRKEYETISGKFAYLSY
ncbi:hypothetical protein [uncultured Bacteroides sp.]|uniref:hypothetical protein n=1 Tax=uncultured Bacteroides sp. TaxID=162156 RepID=UPI002AAB2F96|nr:hypothetical protein [uncultured Bacteroides sp.]